MYFCLFFIGYFILLVIGFQATRKLMNRGVSAIAYGIVFVVCAAVLFVIYAITIMSMSGIQC
jgi:hypothetical protein